MYDITTGFLTVHADIVPVAFGNEIKVIFAFANNVAIVEPVMVTSIYCNVKVVPLKVLGTVPYINPSLEPPETAKPPNPLKLLIKLSILPYTLLHPLELNRARDVMDVLVILDKSSVKFTSATGVNAKDNPLLEANVAKVVLLNKSIAAKLPILNSVKFLKSKLASENMG